jgi:inward rectifier potassium channel
VLEADQIGMLILTWTIIHVINDESPLCTMSVKDLKDANAEIIVVIEGTDDMLGQPVYSRYSYKVENLIWNANYNNITTTEQDGSLTIDVSKIDSYAPTI